MHKLDDIIKEYWRNHSSADAGGVKPKTTMTLADRKRLIAVEIIVILMQHVWYKQNGSAIHIRFGYFYDEIDWASL